MLALLRILSPVSVAFLTLGCSAGDARQSAKLADAALVKGEFDAAISHFDEAIRLDSKYARAYHGRGFAYFQKADYDEAIASYSEAVRLEPENYGALSDRGLASWQKDDPKQAVADFKQAIHVNPQNHSAYNNLAWLMAVEPATEFRDGKKAVELATKAIDMTGGEDPLPMSTLAAAYAEIGDFKLAIEWHKKAMASPGFPPDKMDRARERLKLYENGKPYREVKTKK